MQKQVSGTLEWSVASVNNTLGCKNDCAYCYARAMALRFGRINRPEDWTRMVTRRVRPTRRYDGTVMFPSTHDLFEENIGECIGTARSLLESGNRVLIVSKPRPAVISELLGAIEPWRDQALLRFTIGTLHDDLARTWEPGAPSPTERVEALRAAHAAGWATSVSMEPMLNPCGVVDEFRSLAPFVTDGIWLGKMNKIGSRVVGVPTEAVTPLRAGQSDPEIHRIYQELQNEPKVRWKESIKAVVGLRLETTAGCDR